jgi:hypothetical protein
MATCWGSTYTEKHKKKHINTKKTQKERETHTLSLFPVAATHTKALKRPKKQEAYLAASSKQLQQQAVASGLISSS